MTLDTEQCISHTRAANVDTIAQFQKCMNYLQGFITFWTMLWLNGLVIKLIF